jgi:hypothetical protein
LIKRDGLPLRAAPLWGFQIPQGDDVEKGILLSSFQVLAGLLAFQSKASFQGGF